MAASFADVRPVADNLAAGFAKVERQNITLKESLEKTRIATQGLMEDGRKVVQMADGLGNILSTKLTAVNAFGESHKGALAFDGAMQQVTKTLTTLLTVYTTKVLRDFWHDAIDYAGKYYDALNEIRIVAEKSEEDAARMGEQYRRIAQEMKVSSTEIAQAAVEYFRQGLDEGEVNERLKQTTQLAKIAAISFNEAAELVTSSTNAMGVDAQKVVDTFQYLGKQHCPFVA